MRRGVCTAVGSSRVFVPAADPLFCSAKKVGQKRRPLRWRSALRTDCTRRQELKREASETRCAQTADASLSVSVPGDASPSNGDSRQRLLQKQLQSRCAGNGNGRWRGASSLKTALLPHAAHVTLQRTLRNREPLVLVLAEALPGFVYFPEFRILGGFLFHHIRRRPV